MNDLGPKTRNDYLYGRGTVLRPVGWLCEIVWRQLIRPVDWFDRRIHTETET